MASAGSFKPANPQTTQLADSQRPFGEEVDLPRCPKRSVDTAFSGLEDAPLLIWHFSTYERGFVSKLVFLC
jgi:hypothetical protein